MIISDLQYIESANETEVQGAGGNYYSYKPKYKAPSAVALADSTAAAIGYKTEAKTYTNTTAIAGVAAFAESGSSSKASGY
jgi:hypothetical protein